MSAILPETETSTAIRLPASTPGLLGVLGGMGPLATVDFMQKLLTASNASTDQDHVPSIISSVPQIPDRTEAFRGKGSSPLGAMVECALRLKAAGVGLIVMPCNTAHLWYDEIQVRTEVPMLHIVDAAIEDAVEKVGTNACIGLLATDATLASGLYINRRTGDSSRPAVRWMLPTAQEMLDWVMPGIRAVKAGDLVTGRKLLLEAAKALHQRGAQALVMGCTEIPVVLNDGNAPMPTIDTTAALASRAARWSRSRRDDAGSSHLRVN
ncbi:cysteate racemase [Xanthomonas euvesicatoria]|uniref:aspartate/glutamate racemase family protein n=1 Tax=Xanthomonas euvesicatoria TaxID=456327 RepID=UPI001C462352|nr:amino acid racemase [Xanthomonas euvesicatoria]